VHKTQNFQDFAELHLEGEARQEIREVTRRGYLYLLRTFAFPVFGPLPLDEIKSQDLAAFLLQVRQTHSASQVNHLRAAMSRVFQAALTHQLVTDNPVRRTKRMRAQDGDKTLTQQPWSLDECKEAMEASIGTSMDLFVHLAILSGARLGEMLGLWWSDIDLSARTIAIRRTLVELRGSRDEANGSGGPTFSPPKTARSVRTLTFGQSLSNAFMRHKAMQEDARIRAGEDWVETDCVFTSSEGNPLWSSNHSAAFRRFLKDKGLRHVNIHSMRHAFAVNALALGVDLPSISRALGHASLQITLDIYAKEAQDLQNQATEGLARWFEGPDQCSPAKEGYASGKGDVAVSALATGTFIK
jgi:hypothetical protein